MKVSEDEHRNKWDTAGFQWLKEWINVRLTRLSEATRPKTPRRRSNTGNEHTEPATRQPVATNTEQMRHKRSGGPVDEATYTCSCGMVFAANVSTSVSCPHCGADQAW
jgi:rubrerythrin